MKATHAWAIVGVGIISITVVYLLFATPAAAPSKEITEPYRYVNASADDIMVSLPYPGAVTGKTFSVIGEARGYWFFEASFPAELKTADGTVLWQGPVTTDAEWMTADFVPFRADIIVSDQSFIGPAVLVLKRDNPSGEPENDASLSFDIIVEY